VVTLRRHSKHKAQ